MNRYSIKIVSEITGFPESTLRYYEKVGLLGYVSGNWNGLRMYVDVHSEKLKSMRIMRNNKLTCKQNLMIKIGEVI